MAAAAAYLVVAGHACQSLSENELHEMRSTMTATELGGTEHTDEFTSFEPRVVRYRQCTAVMFDGPWILAGLLSLAASIVWHGNQLKSGIKDVAKARIHFVSQHRRVTGSIDIGGRSACYAALKSGGDMCSIEFNPFDGTPCLARLCAWTAISHAQV